MFLHRFSVAISSAVVNHDDGEGTAPGPLIWSAGSPSQRRRLVLAVHNHAMLPASTISAKMITVLTRYRPIVFELI